MSDLTAVSLFSGGGGLDIGFETSGFSTVFAVDNHPPSINTLNLNRPSWNAVCSDVEQISGTDVPAHPDVLLAGPPCQGFSIGGRREADDQRNDLFQEVGRLAKVCRPRAVVVENVMNLRTMLCPNTGRPFAEEISASLNAAGYEHVSAEICRMDAYGVPQTRRRFLFIAFRGGPPPGWQPPAPSGHETVRRWLWDTAHDEAGPLPNHAPEWSFRSNVHTDRGIAPPEGSAPVLARLSRTASNGHPLRSWERSMPAVDTSTAWGFAQGNIHVEQSQKTGKDNPSDYLLWRIEADRIRELTCREYARVQTFPDDWTFSGDHQKQIQRQIGNAVPPRFAERVALNIKTALHAIDTKQPFPQPEGATRRLF